MVQCLCRYIYVYNILTGMYDAHVCNTLTGIYNSRCIYTNACVIIYGASLHQSMYEMICICTA
jgi:hypothetical protein